MFLSVDKSLLQSVEYVHIKPRRSVKGGFALCHRIRRVVIIHAVTVLAKMIT